MTDKMKRIFDRLIATKVRMSTGGPGDAIRITGEVRMVLRDECGMILVDRTHKNLVVNTGKYHIADQLSDKGEAAMSHMAVGTGSAASPAATNTGLENELDRNALTSITQGTGTEANKVTYIADWAAGDGTGAIVEAGIFNPASKMLCRTTFDVINKGAAHTLQMTWVLTISA